ncbi:unnamed protein product [Lactuca saligna]|uniref:Uncharacterized protein n=1 Tax=Lactuca saligna TaxID=75948 RepID=A0AA36EFW2_LACSI|nr:unnamed protein product [Lactuca saligna]
MGNNYGSVGEITRRRDEGTDNLLRAFLGFFLVADSRKNEGATTSATSDDGEVSEVADRSRGGGSFGVWPNRKKGEEMNATRLLFFCLGKGCEGKWMVVPMEQGSSNNSGDRIVGGSCSMKKVWDARGLLLVVEEKERGWSIIEWVVECGSIDSEGQRREAFNLWRPSLWFLSSFGLIVSNTIGKIVAPSSWRKEKSLRKQVETKGTRVCAPPIAYKEFFSNIFEYIDQMESQQELK